MTNSAKPYIAITASVVALLCVLLNVLTLRTIDRRLRRQERDYQSVAGRLPGIVFDVRRLYRLFQAAR